jgi:hypothetical protein
MTESSALLQLRCGILAVQQDKVSPVSQLHEAVEGMLFVFIVAGIDNVPAPPAEPDDEISSRVAARDSLYEQVPDPERKCERTNPYRPAVGAQGHRPVGRRIDTSQKPGGIFSRTGGHMDQGLSAFHYETGIHTQSQHVVQMQMTYQYVGRTGEVHGSAQNSASRI